MTKESDVLSACLHLLSVHPAVAWAARMNTGAYEVDGRYVRFGFVGCSDIMGQMKDGRLLAFECKRPGGKLTWEQEAFLDRVRRHKGLAGWGGVKELEEMLR